MNPLNHSDIITVFLSLGLLLAAARVLGGIAQRLGQPTVVGEILAGVLLGPTLLGKAAPELSSALFPAAGNSSVVFDGIKSLAIVLFLLVAGMEVQLSTIWRRGASALAVALSGLVVPFAIGLLAGYLTPHALGCELDASCGIFALFFATALSISALPVIAKTLMDLRLYRTELGMIVIAAAVFDDVVGWLIFGVILGLLGTGSAHAHSVTSTIVFTLVFAVSMLTVGRWIIARILSRLSDAAGSPETVLSFAFSLALFAAALTEWIGIHAIFGSFLVGVAIGDSPKLGDETRRTLRNFVSSVFAPLFFASVGLHIDFAANFELSIVLSILAIACLGKVLGCSLTARLTGLDWNTSWAVGFAMNARGAMEIVLGLLALQNGLIGERMFVALVVMALVTSMMSGPMIKRLLQKKKASYASDVLLPLTGAAPELVLKAPLSAR